MALRSPHQADWQQFFRLAELEGWRVPQLERQLFQTLWVRDALVLEEDRHFCGLVTAVQHEQSGWIGNLIVPRELRGRRFGSRLFRAAFELLQRQGLSSVWLTASRLGTPLYVRCGFVTVDRIERWVLPAGAERAAATPPCAVPLSVLLDADQAVWGESRRRFLERIGRSGSVHGGYDTVVLLQRGTDLQVVGPWYTSAAAEENRRLLLSLLATADPAVEIAIDLLASSPVRPLLAEAGFEYCGENRLMLFGEGGEVDLNKMVALASLGSVG